MQPEARMQPAPENAARTPVPEVGPLNIGALHTGARRSYGWL